MALRLPGLQTTNGHAIEICMVYVGLIRRSRHQAFLQQHRFSLYIKSHSEGVVSPLKSANRSVNDKVWTPWMADRGEPRQGASPGTGEQVESSRPQSDTREVSAVRSTDFLAGPRGLIRGARLYEPVTWVTDLTGHIGNTF